MPRFAWYSAQDAERHFAAEKIMGCTLDYRAVINDDSRNGFSSTSSWLFSAKYLGRLRAAGQPYRRIWWSIPGFWKGANLEAAARGGYNGDYEACARDILKVENANNDPVYVRPWFEFNGGWFHWNWVGKEKTGAEAWRQMHRSFRKVSPRFRFEFAPSETSQYTGNFANVEAAWPGDEFVDECGLDLYWKPYESWQWGKDPDVAFQKALTSRYGLNWLEKFAAQHGKPMVLSEVGVQGHNTTSSETINTEPFIRKLAEWCRARDVPVLWWNGRSGEGYLGDIIGNANWPKTRAAVKKHFADPATNGKGGSGSAPALPAEPVPAPTPTPQPAPQPGQPADDFDKLAVSDPAAAVDTVRAEAFNSRGKPADARTVRRWEDALWHAHEALKAAAPDTAPAPQPDAGEAAALRAENAALKEKHALAAAAAQNLAKALS